jgi:hypothetical protein
LIVTYKTFIRTSRSPSSFTCLFSLSTLIFSLLSLLIGKQEYHVVMLPCVAVPVCPLLRVITSVQNLRTTKLLRGTVPSKTPPCCVSNSLPLLQQNYQHDGILLRVHISARRPPIMAQVSHGPSSRMPGITLKLGHDRFHPDSFQFISYLSTIY